MLDRPVNVVKELVRRYKDGSTMACVLEPVNGQVGQYKVEKSHDTLERMYKDALLDGDIVAAECSFQEYLASLSDDSRHYIVDILAGTCSCPYMHLRQVPCKHMFMVSTQ